MPLCENIETKETQVPFPRHLVWSTDDLDLNDPVQRRWYIRQVLLHGRTEDIRTLDLREVAALPDDLNLPRPVYRLWKTFWARKGYFSTGG